MNFMANLDNMSRVISDLDLVYDGIKTDLEKVENAICCLCEGGWSGETKEAYLSKVIYWSIKTRKLLNQIEDLKICLEDNIDDIDALLTRGKHLNI